MRVNKAIEDGSFFENPALRGAFERGRRRPPARARLLRRRPLAHRPPARAAPLRAGRRPGSTRSPTAATSRRTRPSTTSPSCPPSGSRPSSGRYYAMDRDQRWERTQRAFDAISRRGPVTADDPVALRAAASYDAASRTSSSSPSCSTAGRGSSPATPRSSSTSGPTAARQLSQRLLEARLRPDDDDALPRRPRLPGRLRGAGRRRHARRGARRARRSASCTSPRPRSTRTSPTSSTAAARRSGRARRGSSCRRRATSPRYDQKPEMSARRGRRRASAREIGDGYRFAIVNFANPDMVGHTGVDPGRRSQAVETTDGCLGRVRRGGRGAPAACALVTADHGNAEKMLERGRRQPAHGAHDEPRAARRHRAGRRAAGRRRARPTWRRPCLDLLGVEQPAEMTGTDLMRSVKHS